MSHPVTGGCLCGAVRFTATLPSHGLSLCWCTQCLRQNSGPLVCADDAETWEISGEVARYRASDHATRGFCAACGSTIFWQGDGEAPGFALGALDLRDGYRVAVVVHEDTRPDAFDGSAGGEDRGLSARLMGPLPHQAPRIFQSTQRPPAQGDDDDAV